MMMVQWCGEHLKEWNHISFGNVRETLAQKRKLLPLQGCGSMVEVLIYLHMMLSRSRGVHGSGRVGFVPISNSTRSGQVGENQTRNQLPITTGRVGSDSKKRSVGSVETDECWRRGEENELSSDMVGGE